MYYTIPPTWFDHDGEQQQDGFKGRRHEPQARPMGRVQPSLAIRIVARKSDESHAPAPRCWRQASTLVTGPYNAEPAHRQLANLQRIKTRPFDYQAADGKGDQQDQTERKATQR